MSYQCQLRINAKLIDKSHLEVTYMKCYFIEANDDLLPTQASLFSMRPRKTDRLQWWQEQLKPISLTYRSTLGFATRTGEYGRVANQSIGKGNDFPFSTIPGTAKNFDSSCGMGKIGITTLKECISEANLPPSDKLFCIVSSNKAHHFSYCLSQIAFSRHGKTTNCKVILNIDEHQDFGGGSLTHKPGAEIQCGTWGQYHVYEKGWTVPAYYIVYGAHSDGGPRLVGVKPKSETDKTIIEVSHATDDNNLYQEMRKELWKKNCDVYITIDLDCMGELRSHYDTHGTLKLDDVKLRISRTLECMYSNVVGVDITGLPTGKHTLADAEKTAAAIRSLYNFIITWIV